MSRTTFLITGAARGAYGRATCDFLYPILTRVTKKHALTALPTFESTSLIVVKLDLSDPEDASKAIKTLQEQDISRIDVIIANAAMAMSLDTVLETKPEDMAPQFDVNCVGQLRLFQACYPLMKKKKDRDEKEAMFCVITSSIGSIAAMMPMKCLAYACSKAALNFLTRRIHFECEDVTSFAVHPGWVQTEMGAFAAKAWGEEGAPMTVEESAAAVMRLIDQATREETSGKFLSFNGSAIPW